MYTNELSPYGLPHIIEEDPSYISYQDFATKFKPKKHIAVGGFIATTGSTVVVGTVTKIAKKGKGKNAKMHCWFTCGTRQKIHKLDSLIAAPRPHEFVRQISTGIWFVVQGLSHMISLNRILVSPATAKNAVRTATGGLCAVLPSCCCCLATLLVYCL